MQNYSKKCVVGKGSYGEVFLVVNKTDRKKYVLKKMAIQNASKRERTSAQMEVQLLSQLHHPNIVSYKESFSDKNGYLYIVMAYCEGGDLYHRLKEQSGKAIDESQVVEWFVQLALALQYMHNRNILHRDLKTQNIFLTKNNIVKVGDFGIARVLENTADMASTLIGTPYYMSPELFSNKPYNHKSDVWALGCCLYEMATLKHAFNARDMNSLVFTILRGDIPSIPTSYTRELQELVNLMLSHEPDNRPSVHDILHMPFVKKHISMLLEKNAQKRKRQVPLLLSKSSLGNEDVNTSNGSRKIPKERLNRNQDARIAVSNDKNTEREDSVASTKVSHVVSGKPPTGARRVHGSRSQASREERNERGSNGVVSSSRHRTLSGPSTEGSDNTSKERSNGRDVVNDTNRHSFNRPVTADASAASVRHRRRESSDSSSSSSRLRSKRSESDLSDRSRANSDSRNTFRSVVGIGDEDSDDGVDCGRMSHKSSSDVRINDNVSGGDSSLQSRRSEEDLTGINRRARRQRREKAARVGAIKSGDVCSPSDPFQSKPKLIRTPEQPIDVSLVSGFGDGDGSGVGTPRRSSMSVKSDDRSDYNEQLERARRDYADESRRARDKLKDFYHPADPLLTPTNVKERGSNSDGEFPVYEILYDGEANKRHVDAAAAAAAAAAGGGGGGGNGNNGSDMRLEDFDVERDDENDQQDLDEIVELCNTQLSILSDRGDDSDEDEVSFVSPSKKLKRGSVSSSGTEVPAPGRLAGRIFILRDRCVQGLGQPLFERAYDILKTYLSRDRAETALVKLLGPERFKEYASMIDQLIFIETAAYV